MSVICELAAPFVANRAVDGKTMVWPFLGHTDVCLKCQARHAAMTRVAREMSALSRETYIAPLDLEWKVMSSLEGELAVARSWKTPVALTAAVVSMAAAFLIWRLRPRTQA